MCSYIRNVNMKINSVIQGVQTYKTPKFQGKLNEKDLALLLTKNIQDVKAKCTQGHFDNIFFKTNLNDILRHPEAQLIDELQYMAMSMMPNSIKSGLGEYYKKIPIKEKPNILKQKLNEEFKLLPQLTAKQQYYRGIENVSDAEYKLFERYRKGEIVSPDKGYSYMTTSLEEANLYNKGHNGILFEMEFPEGSQVSELQTIMPPKTPGFMFGEIKNEVVVPAGSLYEVTKNPRVDKDGILHIYLKFLNKWE